MKLASLKEGQFVETGGYYTKGDAGQAKYLIVAAQAADGYSDHTLANGTVAVLQHSDSKLNLLQFGCKFDGTTTDTAAAQAAFNIGGTIIAPSNAKTKMGSITVVAPISIEGNNSEFEDLGLVSSAATIISPVRLRGMKFTTTAVAGVNAPYAINLRNIDNIDIKKCTFVNVRTSIRGDNGIIQYGVLLEDNEFDCNFSDWDYVSSQQDVIDIRGIQNVNITKNRIFATNVNRVFKIAAGTDQPAANPTGITNVVGLNISNNFIRGSVDTGGKQLLDLFNGTVEVNFESNSIDVTGFTTIYESKTGFSYTTLETLAAHNIHNNTVKSDGLFVKVQGAYGATGWVSNSYDTVKVSGNTYDNTSSLASDATVSCRFLNDIIVSNNTFNCKNIITDHYHLDISSCKIVNIQGGEYIRGGMVFATATTNAGGFAFNSQIEFLTVNGVVIDQYDNRAAIMPKDLPVVKSIVITNNTVTNDNLGASQQSAYWVRSCTVTDLIVTGNTAYIPPQTSLEKLSRNFSTVSGRLIDKNNGWLDKIYADSELNDISNDVNTQGKYESRVVFNNTQNLWVYASNLTAGGGWKDMAKNTINTPV